MAVSQSQRLRRMAEKASRRRQIVAQKQRTELQSGVGSQTREIAQAARAPFEDCLVSERLFENGIGWLVAARRLPSGTIAAGFFLIDVWCLGVKDAFFREMPRDAFEARIDAVADDDPMTRIDAAVARKLLEDAASYAETFGLSACESFGKIEAIFGDVVPAEESFTFGKDGKPFYFSGPNDTPARIKRIVETLRKSVGAEGFDFMINAAGL